MRSTIVDLRRASRGHDSSTPGHGAAAPAPALDGNEQPRREPGLPDLWRQWVAEGLLGRVPARQLIATVVEAGFDRHVAAAEVEAASRHPYVRAGEESAQRLLKLQSMLDIRHRLASLSSGGRSVERRGPVSRAEFLERYYAANRPVILTGLMEQSAARARWTPEYLKQMCGEAMVEIMAGRNQDARYEINSERHKQSVRFADYVDMVTRGGSSNDYYLVANNGLFGRPEARRLVDELCTFPEYLDPSRIHGQVFFWFGPSGTVTPLHHDVMNVLMTQVYGSKQLLLVAPDQTHLLDNRVGVFSEVDPEAPDDTRHPLFRGASVLSARVEAGDAIFLPVGWWHHVRSLTVSVTVSYTNFVFPNEYQWIHPSLGTPAY